MRAYIYIYIIAYSRHCSWLFLIFFFFEKVKKKYMLYAQRTLVFTKRHRYYGRVKMQIIWKRTLLLLYVNKIIPFFLLLGSVITILIGWQYCGYNRRPGWKIHFMGFFFFLLLQSVFSYGTMYQIYITVLSCDRAANFYKKTIYYWFCQVGRTDVYYVRDKFVRDSGRRNSVNHSTTFVFGVFCSLR